MFVNEEMTIRDRVRIYPYIDHRRSATLVTFQFPPFLTNAYNPRQLCNATVFFLCFVMITLHNIPGRYEVGCTTFSGTLPEQVIVGSSRYKASHIPGRVASAPTLPMKQIAFTAYYPANTGLSHNGKSSLLPRGKVPWLSGYVR